MEKVSGETLNIVDDNIRKLKEIFPEVFNEDKVDFEKLEAVLGEYKDEGTERYNFTWPGKSKAIRIAQTPSTGTLRPCKEESKDWDTTQNLYIEGDNLEVLKLLQKSYYGRVKMIYIDPPYNTGNDFIYKDDFRDNIGNYLEITRQRNSQGNKINTNTESDGRYHSNWLNLMYPRLKLASNLLKKDGAIFISIDDNEVTNLKKICDEIFGEENFINIISAKMKNIAGASGGGEDKRLKKNIEYIMIYAKSYVDFDGFEKVYEYTEIESLLKKYNDDNKSWKYTSVMVNKGEKRYITSTVDGDGNEIKIYKRENAEFSSINKLAKENEMKIGDTYLQYFDSIYTTAMPQSSIRTRVFEAVKDLNEEVNSESLYSIEYIPKSGKYKGKVYEQFYKGEKMRLFAWFKDVAEIIDGKVFKKDAQGTLWEGINLNNLTKEGEVSYSNGKKPLDLMNKIISMMKYESGDIVLDFFAGSSSTAHAVMNNNINSDTNTKFIMNQINTNLDIEYEKASGENKKTIKEAIEFLDSIKKQHILSELGKERIKRAGKKIKEENSNKQGIEKLDIGFKVFKLDSSNINRWDSSYEQNLEQTLLTNIDNIKENRSEEDILYELLLKYGIDLNMPIEEHNIAGKKVFNIGFGALIVCLDNDITLEVVEGIGKLKEELDPDICRVVFMDNGFSSDSVKTNAIKILNRFNIEDIKSI